MSHNPSGAIHPTVFLLLWTIASFGLHYFWPISIPEWSLLELAGRIVMVLGGVIMVWTQIVFRRHGTSTDHSRPTTALITEGPFRYSRNPIYVVLTGILTGLAMAYSNVWGLILVIPFVIALVRLTILREEAYLEKQFGGAYTHYRNSVRRWL
jgi:protein-S-isoprenylcysteine O-methyltransferase Ste14